MEMKSKVNIKNLSGFTLVELLVVIFIIGMVSGYTVLSLGSRDADDSLAEEANRLRQLLILAADEALVSGRPVGLLIQSNGYQFKIAGRQSWEPITNPSILSGRTYPLVEVRLQLSHGGSKALYPNANENPPTEETQPQIVFYPSGEVDPFALKLLYKEGQLEYQLNMPQSGQIELISMNED